MKLILLNENIELNAIKIFGTTHSANKAGFILTDGRLLDLSIGRSVRTLDHRSISDVFDKENYDGTESLIAFMNMGNIRVMPELPSLDIVLEPTDAQYETIRDVIKQLAFKDNYISIQISDSNGCLIEFWDYEHINIDLIIEDIKYYFKTKKNPVEEAYLDSEEKFYDYGTSSVDDIKSEELFDRTKTGMSFYNDILHNPKYMRDRKGLVGSIIMMSPNEYFQACSDIFKSSFQRQVDQTAADKENIEHLKLVILKYHRKFPIAFLNYAENTQEGRHRMYVAGELQGWDKKQPVLIVQKSDYILYPNELILKEDYYNKIDLSSDVDDETILQDLKNNFEVTNKPTYGGYYILPTGEFLKSNNHLDIDKYLMRKKYIKKQDLDFADGSQFLEVKLNCIRVRSRGGKDSWINPYIVLPKNKPTINQEYSLLNWLDFIFSNNQTMLINTETNGEFKSYNSDNYTSDEVLDKINRYYSSGKLLN